MRKKIVVKFKKKYVDVVVEKTGSPKKAAKELKVAYQTVWNVINLDATPYIENLIAIARYHQVSIEDLLDITVLED